MEFNKELYDDLKKGTDEARKSVLYGMVSETYARWKLQERGYNVVKILRIGRDKKTNTKKNYFYLNFQFIERAILKDYKGDKEKIRNLLKEQIRDLPDFICYKDGEISFAEIKTNEGSARDSQNKRFDYLRNEGFKVIVLNVNLNLDISLKE
jgi:hypothetical protein